MAQSSSVTTRRQAGVFLMVTGLLAGLLAILAPVANAAPITPGTNIANFEIDGNFAVDAPPLVDWAGITDLANRLTFDDNLQTPDPNGPGDQGFIGGAKEGD